MEPVSVVIPVKNGGATLEKCLASIRQQTISEIEIIVLDSSSNDNSVAIARQFNCKVVPIAPGTFNHGLTRNRGVSEATADLVFFTVQDAYLAEPDQLAKMAALFQDAQLAGVVGMQAVPPDEDKNPAKWFQRFSAPTTTYKYYSQEDFSQLSKGEQLLKAAEWDDVNAMYRKQALLEVPFIKTDFAEDKFWAIDAMKRGLKLAFDPSFVVFHYHHHSFMYSFRVQYIINYNYYRFGRLLPALPPFFKPLLLSVYRVVNNKRISVIKKLYWSIHNIASALGNFLSNALFLVIGKLFGESGLEKSYNIFCRTVPQGRVKSA